MNMSCGVTNVTEQAIIVPDVSKEIKGREPSESYKMNPKSDILKQKKTFLKFAASLLLHSSVYPISQASHVQSKSRKAFWFIVFIFCIVGCCYDCYRFLNIYLQYPVLMSIDLQSNTSVDFPAVTICNLNPMKIYYKDCVLEKWNWTECMQSNSHESPTLIMSERKNHTRPFDIPNVIKENYLHKAETFMNCYTNTDAKSRKCYGYTLHELTKRCSFNSVLCNESDFAFFQNMQYGNCYTFNRKRSGEKNRKVFKAGPEGGLELELDLMVDSYLDFTQTVGARVVIHNPDEDPNPEEDGVNISPGLETHISLIKTSIQRLPTPYRDHCMDYTKRYNNKGSVKSQLDCIRKCIQDLSMSLCSCVDPFLRSSLIATRCDLKNSTQMSCLNYVSHVMHERERICECPLPCMMTTYSVEVGSSPWVIDSSSSLFSSSHLQLNFLKEGENETLQLCSTDQNFHGANFGYTHSVSHANLKVFYRSLDHTIYSQTAMFTESELFAHLGGHMGLWLGISFMALFECAENIFLSLTFFTRRYLRKL